MTLAKTSTALLGDLRQIIEQSRGRAAVAVNSELVLLYWMVGRRIRSDLLGEERAEYGKQIVSTVAVQLSTEYGRGFNRRNLYNMLRFAELFPDEEIVHALRTQLTWTHLRELIAIDDPLKRQFYTEMCRVERWATRTLKAKVGGLLYERTAIAKRPDAVISRDLDALRDEDKLGPDLIFRDPYLLDFLGLSGDHSEDELEVAILRELETFLLELGTGFSFVARQKRMSIGADDYYLDLLFFHRPLRALVAIELKLGRFDARDKGQMELYLRWLDKYERQPGENPPLGLILCSDKNQEQIELLELSEGSLRVASYLTELPPREVLQRKLMESIEHARTRIALPASEGEEESP
jgi:predicted nuclease of restriction endonuclease-like (RecB) superfamily